MNCARCETPLDPGAAACLQCGAPVVSPLLGESVPSDTVMVDIHSLLEGKWKLISKLGEGGMGTVYLAHDQALDREVAVKILAKQLSADKELVTRFEREAKMTAKLEHGNIVPVYAVGRYDGRPFIVMKKLEGQTLSQVLRDKGALSVDETLAVVRQVALGLDFIHQKGFVHRDIKASNIYIGSDGHATILDFGILRSRESQEMLTRTGMVMGTPQYMSPEQAIGSRDIDHRSDLYALAVLAYECLTGTLPFDGENELSIIQMQAHMPPPDLLQRAPWVPKAVADVIQRALSKRPDERYPSAGEFHQALATARDLAADAGPIPAVPPGSRRASGEKPRMLPTTPAVPSGMGRAAIEAELRRSHELPAAVSVEPGPSTDSLARVVRSRRPVWIGGGIALVFLLGGGAWLAFGREPPPEPPPPEPMVATPAMPLRINLLEDAGAVAVATPPDAGASAQTEDPEEPEVVNHHGDMKHAPPRPLHDKGSLKVVTTLKGEPYWAAVTIDGVRKGTTPMSLELPIGRHQLKVERIGFKTVSQTVKVTGVKTAVVLVELHP